MSGNVVFDSSVGFLDMLVQKFDSACVPWGMEKKSNSEQNYFLYFRFPGNMQTRVCLPLSVPDYSVKTNKGDLEVVWHKKGVFW